MRGVIKKFKNERGQGMTEYVVVLVAIGLTLAWISLIVRDWVLDAFSRYSLVMSMPFP